MALGAARWGTPWAVRGASRHCWTRFPSLLGTYIINTNLSSPPSTAVLHLCRGFLATELVSAHPPTHGQYRWFLRQQIHRAVTAPETSDPYFSDPCLDSERTQSGPTRHVSMGVAHGDAVRFPCAKAKCYLVPVTPESWETDGKQARRECDPLRRTIGSGKQRQIVICLGGFCPPQQDLTPWRSHSEAGSRWAGQEIPRLLRNPKCYYSVHKNPPPGPILSQMNPIHNPKPCFPKIHFNSLMMKVEINRQ
jgi:hypothetical protein